MKYSAVMVMFNIILLMLLSFTLLFLVRNGYGDLINNNQAIWLSSDIFTNGIIALAAISLVFLSSINLLQIQNESHVGKLEKILYVSIFLVFSSLALFIIITWSLQIN